MTPSLVLDLPGFKACVVSAEIVLGCMPVFQFSTEVHLHAPLDEAGRRKKDDVLRLAAAALNSSPALRQAVMELSFGPTIAVIGGSGANGAVIPFTKP